MEISEYDQWVKDSIATANSVWEAQCLVWPKPTGVSALSNPCRHTTLLGPFLAQLRIKLGTGQHATRKRRSFVAKVSRIASEAALSHAFLLTWLLVASYFTGLTRSKSPIIAIGHALEHSDLLMCILQRCLAHPAKVGRSTQPDGAHLAHPKLRDWSSGGAKNAFS